MHKQGDLHLPGPVKQGNANKHPVKGSMRGCTIDRIKTAALRWWVVAALVVVLVTLTASREHCLVSLPGYGTNLVRSPRTGSSYLQTTVSSSVVTGATKIQLTPLPRYCQGRRLAYLPTGSCQGYVRGIIQLLHTHSHGEDLRSDGCNPGDDYRTRGAVI